MPLPQREHAEPATEAQKNYAIDLGLRFPQDISKRDMSHLLDKRLSSDGDPNPELVEYAENRGLYPSVYIGKRALYNYIFSNLEGTDCVAFFIFCIYRYTSDDRWGNLDTHPKKDVFYALATELEADPKFLKSMEQYEGEDLRFFGTLRVRGESYEGGSTRTTAYKSALAALQSSFTLSTKETHRLPEEYIRANNNQNRMVGALANQSPGMKSKWVALFLCIFLGFLGAHKFYEGNTKMGKTYLFTLGLFGIGWFIDIVTLLLKPNSYRP